MPRMARVVAEAVPHHITQRGNNRQDTFFLPDDRSFYLETLRAKCRDHGVAVLVIRKSDSSTLEPGEGVCIKEALIEVMMGRERNTFPLPPEQH